MVSHGLKTLDISAGHTKPTTQPGLVVPIPTIQVNDDELELEFEKSEQSDEEQGNFLPATSDESGLYEDLSKRAIHSEDIVARSVHKVSQL